VANQDEDEQLHGCEHQRLARDELPRVCSFPEAGLRVFLAFFLFA